MKTSACQFFVVGLFALCACGDSGSGGAGGSPASGGAGAGGAPTGGGAADGGAGGGAGGLGGGAVGGAGGGYTCTPDITDDPCTACMRASCCDVFSECVQDPTCVACYECLTNTPQQQQQMCFTDGTCPASGSMETDLFIFCRQDCGNNGC